MRKYLLGIGICALSCSAPADRSEPPPPPLFENMDRRTQLRLQSYIANGQRLYNTYCVNCHQRDGRGLRQLIPPLRQADYIKDHKKVACLIKYGIQGPLRVNDILYDAPMPAQKQLRNIQIAEIMSYIGNAWGNREGLIAVKEIDPYLDSCFLSNTGS